MPLTITTSEAHGDAPSVAVTEALHLSLQGSNAGWTRAALQQADGDPLAAALDAAALASALALRAASFLEAEMRERDTKFLQEEFA